MHRGPYSQKRKLYYVVGAQRPILTKKETYTPYVVGAQRHILTKLETYTPCIMGAQRPILASKGNLHAILRGCRCNIR